MPGCEELKRFCDKDTNHYFYRKADGSGSIRMTRVSKRLEEIRIF